MSAIYWIRRSNKLLAGLVLFLAVPTLWSWLEPVDAVLAVKRSSDGGRSPASIGPVSSFKEKSGRLSHPILLEWNAGGKEFSKDVNATHVRLKGLLRGMKAESITNQTNGFTAAVFVQGSQYSTDFIELKEGSNTIAVKVADSKGKVSTKKIELIRRMPASASNQNE